jgi:beta-glucosidase
MARARLAVVTGCERNRDRRRHRSGSGRRAADVVLLAIGEPQRFSGERSRAWIDVPPRSRRWPKPWPPPARRWWCAAQWSRAGAARRGARGAGDGVTWFPGSQNGHAMADVVFGDYSPSAPAGQLPDGTGQQPYFYNHPRTGRPELPT